MNKVISSILVFFIIVAGIFSNPLQISASNDLGLPTDKVLATWIWDTSVIQTDPQGTLDFLIAKGFNAAYLQINRDIPKAAYKTFIESASAQGIQVYALGGSSSWVMESTFKSGNTFMTWVSSYQSEASASQKFQGIHLDIEPYVLAKWSTNQKAVILAFQKLMTQMKLKADGMGLSLGADIAFWFDGVKYNNIFGTGNLAQWMITQMNSVTLMSYRDTAASITSLVKDELQMGVIAGKQVHIAVETSQSSEGNYLSFYEEGEAVMVAQLQLLVAQELGYSSFGGIAIHHFGSYKTMQP